MSFHKFSPFISYEVYGLTPTLYTKNALKKYRIRKHSRKKIQHLKVVPINLISRQKYINNIVQYLVVKIYHYQVYVSPKIVGLRSAYRTTDANHTHRCLTIAFQRLPYVKNHKAGVRIDFSTSATQWRAYNDIAYSLSLNIFPWYKDLKIYFETVGCL